MKLCEPEPEPKPDLDVPELDLDKKVTYKIKIKVKPKKKTNIPIIRNEPRLSYYLDEIVDTSSSTHLGAGFNNFFQIDDSVSMRNIDISFEGNNKINESKV